ncbi:hypothetical protein G6L68_20125 [Agrobacterium fabrum]|uniref:hypothetical protein n=1 Tax=Agrobacterium fabrum TaxID=1176649 RepID=UPI0013CED77C|nr:hypothetical protein [Agrobacterium fabrum]NTE62965.1 hypothetical protein [Agrobacterium fabrum]
MAIAEIAQRPTLRAIMAYFRAKIAKPHRFGSKKSKTAFPTVENLLVGRAQEFTDSGINPPYA